MTEEPMSSDSNKERKFDFSLLLKYLLTPQLLAALIQGTVGSIVGAMAVAWVFDLWLSERDQRITEFKDATIRLETRLNNELIHADSKIQQVSNAFVLTSNRIAETRAEIGAYSERLARLETLIEFQTEILTQGRPPMVEAGFTPLAENPVEMGMGGGNPLLDRALGFGKYELEFDLPKTNTELKSRIQETKDEHLKYLTLGLENNTFDSEAHELFVDRSIIRKDNGDIKLRLYSYVIKKPQAN